MAISLKFKQHNHWKKHINEERVFWLFVWRLRNYGGNALFFHRLNRTTNYFWRAEIENLRSRWFLWERLALQSFLLIFLRGSLVINYYFVLNFCRFFSWGRGRESWALRGLFWVPFYRGWGWPWWNLCRFWCLWSSDTCCQFWGYFCFHSKD